jgi:hypothetical protein
MTDNFKRRMREPSTTPRDGGRARRQELSLPLICPACRDRLTFAEVLEATTAALPASAVLVLRCPLCGADARARIRDGIAETIAPGGSGVPRVVSFEILPELAVAARGSAVLEVWYAGQHRLLRAPRSPSAPSATARRR